MKNNILQRRRSGILAHISSLPGRFGIGDIGPASYHFLDFLLASGQSCWQFLPLNPTKAHFDNSPYMSTSAFAGSLLLISPELLLADGLISRQSLDNHGAFSQYSTDYAAVGLYKKRLLAEAFGHFKATPSNEFETFTQTHPWLIDHALFMVLKEHYDDKGWFEWPAEIAFRKSDALVAAMELHAERILYYQFEQYIFYRQWGLLRKKAADLEIQLFGDIPIYVGLDSVDVWAHQEIFALDEKSGKPTEVAGVPPDYFSDTGQRWGNPLYRWNSKDSKIQQKLTNWWVARFKAMFELVDIARIDHFRGFASYWAIPAKEKTAIKGQWKPGPGKSFFAAVEEQLGPLKIIAEDLGIITEEVNTLRDELGFPGMKVLQFAFDDNPDNSFLPHNYATPNCVVYTGTHDNDTTVGWYLSERVDDGLRRRIKQVSNKEFHDNDGVHNDLIYLALSSTSLLSIIPLQDVLGFGSDCRMNRPGVPTGNWGWRCGPEFFTDELSSALRSRTELFGRTLPPSS